MASQRKRYYLWLFKAYVKRMRSMILSSLVLGILVFFAAVGLLNYYFRPLLQKSTTTLGYWGAYRIESIPEGILNKVSYGLTSVTPENAIVPAAAAKWEISKDGKVYTFHLKKGQQFHNGDELTSDSLQYNFQDVKAKKIDKYTVSYTLKEPYAPFIYAVSKPILTKDFSGLGNFKVKDVSVNGGFVKTITLASLKDATKKERIFFYPTSKALKVAFALGEVDTAFELMNDALGSTTLKEWDRVTTKQYTDYSTMVAVFYSNTDDALGNKKVRQALNYALPAKVADGERSYGPIPPNSIYFEKAPNYGISDLEIAKTLLSTVEEPIKKPLEISTVEEYKDEAIRIQKAWKNLGVSSKVVIVTEIPSNFQVLLYRYKLPKDPDQYILWHSAQKNNIVNFKDLRIDKLLEDGRLTTDLAKRKKIYADFQKYLTDDVPASFYYFPYEYTISRH